MALAQSDYRQQLEHAKRDLEGGRFQSALKELVQADLHADTPNLAYSDPHRDDVILWAEVLLTMGDFHEQNMPLDPSWEDSLFWEEGRVPGAGRHPNPEAVRRRDIFKETRPEYKSKILFLRAEVERAEWLCDYALRDYAAALGSLPQEADRERARYLTARAGLYVQAARMSDAEADLRKALDLESAQRDSAGRAYALVVQGDLERLRENYNKAHVEYSEAVRILQKLGGEQRPLQARAQLGLAELALLDYKLDEAKSQLIQAYSFCNKLPDSQVFAAVEDAQGRLSLAEGDHPSAETSLKAAQASRIKAFGDPDVANSPDIAESEDHLGRLELAKGNLDAAARTLEQARDHFRKALGSNHPDLALALDHLAIAYLSQHRYQDAANCLQEAQRIQTANLGAGSLAAARTHFEIGNLEGERHDPKAVERAYRQALATQKSGLAETHPDRLNTERALGILLHTAHQDDEARLLLVSWMKLMGQSLAANDPQRKEVVTMLLAMADTLYGQGKLKDAVDLYSLIAPGLPATLDAAEIWKRLGDCYNAQKKPAEAARAYESALSIRSVKLGPQDSKTVATLILLGGALVDSSQLETADKYLSGFAQKGASFTLDSLQLIEKFTRALQAAHRAAKAEQYLRAALAFAKRPGPGAQELEPLLVQLAETCADEEKYIEAADFYEQRAHCALRKRAEAAEYLQHALDMRQKVEKPGSLGLVNTLQLLADADLTLAKYQDATKLFLWAKDILDKSAQRDDPRLAVCFNGLGRVAQSREQTDHAAYQEASRLYENAASQLARRPNPDRRIEASIFCNQGFLASENGQSGPAQSFFKRCRDIFDEEFTADDPPPLDQIKKVAGFYRDSGNLVDAEQLYQRAEQLSASVFGKDSVELANAYADLADLAHKQNKDKNAAEFGELALAIYEKNYGRNSSAVRNCLADLSTYYRNDHKYSQAIAYLERAIEIDENSKQDKLDQIIDDLKELAKIYKDQGDKANVVATYQRLERRLETKDPKDLQYVTAVFDLAVAQSDNHQRGEAQKTFSKVKRQVFQNRTLKARYNTELKPNGVR